MRYKWIQLQGYIGFYNGMGLNQVNIDFTKCKSNKIIIRGSNGSGKSTLMNAINVNPDSNDNFIPNMEARKNICLVDNGVEYIIRYIHPITNNETRGTTKGYISKCINGTMVELNPNGNISSCKDIIYDEFNLDSNFMSLSQLSSEDRGLVDRKPADRKKLINGIIDALEVYNGIYKNLSKKASVFKSTINSLSYKIDYIGDETTVKLNLSSIEERINNLEQEKSSNIEAIAGVKLKIHEYNETLRNNDYDAVIKELDSNIKLKDSLDKYLSNQLQSLNIDINKLDDFINYVDKQCISMEAEIEILRKQIPTLFSKRDVEFKELQSKQEKLKSLQSDYNYIDIKNAKLEYERIISEYEKVFNEMRLMNIELITKEEYNSAMDSLRFLKESADALTSSHDIATINDVFINRDSYPFDILNISKMRSSLDDMKHQLSDIEKEMYIYKSKRDIAKELVNRPKNCKIDTCPYIENALKANNEFPEDNYNILISKYNELENEIAELQNKISKTEIASEILICINNIERELDSKIKFIMKLPIRKDFKETFIIRVCNLDQFDDIIKLYKYIDCGNMIEEYNNAKRQLHEYEIEYKLYESKNQIIESIIYDIESLTEKTNSLAQDIENINNSLSEKENELHDLKTTKSKLDMIKIKISDEYNPCLEKIQELNEIKQTLDINVKEIDSLQNTLNNLNNNISSIESDIKVLSADRDKLKHSLSMLIEYKEELEVYQNKYTKIEKIKYYSSPSTGIQTLFMQLYMNNILSTANNLLSLLFNGEFILQPFIINENEFRIPCACLGLTHDDISSMSTSQKCMISMILSFSLLHHSSSKYNVIKLDEIDGGLDTTNRTYFITLLDQLMSMLKCEQCFIVSHNNELSNNNCDVILLKSDNINVDSYSNIIWKY